MIRLVVHGIPPPVVPLTIESWNLDSARNMGTNEVTWRVTISGASRTSEYIVCNVDCCRVCSSHDKDCINKGINWGKIKITKIELCRLRVVPLFLQFKWGEARKTKGGSPSRKKSIPSRAFSHARGHFRVSRVSLNGLRKERLLVVYGLCQMWNIFPLAS